MKKLRVGDPVIVIAGKFKKKVSTIEKIDEENVFVKWINEVKRATKGKWFLKKHLPLHISDVMYYVETQKKPTRIKIDIAKDGKKIRKSVQFDAKI